MNSTGFGPIVEPRLQKAGGGRVTRLNDLIKAVRELPNVKGRRVVETNEFRVAPRNMPKDREEAAAYYDTVSPDSLEDILHTARTMNDHFMVGPRLKKAGGGRIGATGGSIRAIKQALSHINDGDRTAAVRVLSSADPTPEIRRVIDMLRSPQSPSASRTLRETLASTDPEHNKLTPFLADGGAVKPHNPANDYEPGLNREANIRDGFPPRMSRAEREDLERRFGRFPPPIPPRQVAKKAGGGRIKNIKGTLDRLGAFLAEKVPTSDYAVPAAGDPRRVAQEAINARTAAARGLVDDSVNPIPYDGMGYERSPAEMERLRALARAKLLQETPVDLRAARGYTSGPDPRAALSPVQDSSPMRAIGDRMALIEDVVRSMPAGPARDTLVDEYSGLRRQLGRHTGK